MNTPNTQYDKKAFENWLANSPLFRDGERRGYEFLGGRKLSFNCDTTVPGKATYTIKPRTEAIGLRKWDSQTRLTVSCERPYADKLANPQVKLVVEEFSLSVEDFGGTDAGSDHEDRVVAAVEQTILTGRRRSEADRAIFTTAAKLITEALLSSNISDS